MKKLLWIMMPILWLGCAKDDSEDGTKEDFVAFYGGTPFKGTAEAVRSQNGMDDYRWQGKGSVILMEASPDSVSLVFIADFDEQGEINFKFRGKHEGLSYKLEAEGTANYFRIVNQKISGLIDNAEQKIQFDGTMQEESTKMSIMVQFRQANGAFPAGSTLALTFDTRRDVEASGDGTDGCQMRLVPIWGPSGMTMGMVPDC